MGLDKGVRHFARCVQCAPGSRPAASARCFSSVTAHRSSTDVSTSQSDTGSTAPPPSPSAPPSDSVTTKRRDPYRVSSPAKERKLLKEQGLMPVGSRRRRAALATTGNIPFSQLPYQCFQEARSFLQADRQEKLEQIDLQRARIQRLLASENAQDEVRVQNRARSMRIHLDELKILADSNDPLIKKRFEDGIGDMDKPIYRHLADRKWRSYKRVLLMQRIEQMNVVPDVLPAIDPTVSTVLSFGRRKIEHGAFVDSLVSEQAPKLDIQCFDKGKRLVTIAVVTPDVPNVAKDGFDYRCHFLASNIEISPTAGRVDLSKLDESTQVILPWLPAYAQKGASYHRMSIFIFQQSPPGSSLTTSTHSVDVSAVKQIPAYTTRDRFKLRSYADKYRMTPVGVDLFRTQWDEGTADVMQRNGLVGWDVEFRRKKIEPLPYKLVGMRCKPAEMYAKTASEMPDNWTMALALTIVKNKPSTQSISAYICSLRNHLCDHSAQRRVVILRFRPLSYYKHMLQQSQDQVQHLSQLLDRCQSENEDLQQKLGMAQQQSASRKRKAGNIDNPGQSVSALTDDIASLVDTYHQRARVQNSNDTADMGPATQLLQYMYSLRVASLLGSAVKSARFDDHCIRAISLTPSVIEQATTSTNADDHILNFDKAIQVSDRLLAIVFKRMATQSTSQRVTESDAKLVHACARLFDKLYKLLELIARQSAKKGRPTRRSKRRKVQTQRAAMEQGADPKALVALLCGMMTALKSESECHRQLFEAFAYVVLMNAGSHLYAATFNTSRPDKLEDGIIAGRVITSKIGSEELGDMKCLWPHLIQLLMCSMDLAPSFLEPDLKANVERLHNNKTNSNNSPKHALVCAARDRLQYTLISGFDGTKTTSKEGSLQLLSIPQLPQAKARPIKAPESDSRDWFVGEVWRLVGWDVLRRDDG